MTALKVPKHGIQGNSTFELVCRHPLKNQRSWLDLFVFRIGAELATVNELSLLLPMNMRSVVTPYVPVITGSIIGLQVIIASYRVALCGPIRNLAPTSGMTKGERTIRVHFSEVADEVPE